MQSLYPWPAAVAHWPFNSYFGINNAADGADKNGVAYFYSTETGPDGRRYSSLPFDNEHHVSIYPTTLFSEPQGQQMEHINFETLSSHTLLWTTATTSWSLTASLSLCGSSLDLGVCHPITLM